MNMRLTSKNRFLQICFKSSDLGIFHDALPCDYNTIRPGPGSSSRAHHHLDRQYCTNITEDDRNTPPPPPPQSTGNIAQILKKMTATHHHHHLHRQYCTNIEEDGCTLHKTIGSAALLTSCPGNDLKWQIAFNNLENAAQNR